MSVGRFYDTATLLGNGKVLVVGGIDSSISSSNTAELYDPNSGTWSLTGSLHVGRESHTATLLGNGKVLVVGGQEVNGSGIDLNTAELYDPISGIWSLTGSMHIARYAHTATLLGNGKVLIAGGVTSSNYLTSAELYDPSSGTWSFTGNMNIGRGGHTATLLGNGKVLVSGGYIGSSVLATTTVELYDPSSGTWAFTSSMNRGRHIHTATLLGNGKVLVAGGEDRSFNPLASAELYDPESGIWSFTSNMSMGRELSTATMLENGNVLVAGGSGSNGRINTAELYDPSSGTWSLTGSLQVGRYNHTATLLRKGKVLVAGGTAYRSSVTTTAELYAEMDTTAPVLQLPSTITVNATSPSGATVTYTVTATDPDNPSNQLTIACSPASGTTFASGSTTVACAVSDPAGNIAHGSFFVVVVGVSGQLTNLISLVNSFHLKRGIQGRLDMQLYAVQRTIAAGKTMMACQQLAAFSKLVRNFTNRSGLTSLQAQQLLMAATTLQKVLGC